MTHRAAFRHLLVFARAPRPGAVKTRLIPALGADGAAALYWQLLADTLEAAGRCDCDARSLWLDGDDPGRRLRAMAGGRGMTLRRQPGGDLGQRMHAALADALAGGAHAVLIGSDCAAWPDGYLDAAFAALDGHDAVLGPAADGGYLLLGLRRPAPTLFTGVAWGGAQVLAATRERLHAAALRWHELPTVDDVDRPADLPRFPALLARAGLAPGGDASPTLNEDTKCTGSTANP